jgi:2-polyprenyl-3-methyl-5-hydroxy-6-metoxy-1,4-benzoquinol methylase
MKDPLRVFDHIGYKDFKHLAQDNTLSPHEKIGFPNQYRENKEEVIFNDIQSKLTHLSLQRKTILDIGAGCGLLTQRLIKHCEAQQHRLILIDSLEVLSQLPDSRVIQKIPGCFPNEIQTELTQLKESIDVILCYSVLHYIFQENNLFAFFDQALALLGIGGQLLIGDIPNYSMRTRFFSSPTGVTFHQEFMQTTEPPELHHNKLMLNKIDDSIILGLLLRARSQGFNAYLLPQDPQLPMANRREDLLILRP